MEIISESRARAMSVLTLAFVGDAVFTLFVRETLSLKFDFKPGALTARVGKIVSASCQSKMFETVLPLLSEDELAIVKTARNAHTGTKAKNASLSDYKRATALEALIGYLYLTGKTERLSQVEEICLQVAEK